MMQTREEAGKAFYESNGDEWPSGYKSFKAGWEAAVAALQPEELKDFFFQAGWDAANKAAEIVPPRTNADGTLRLLDSAELKAANAERVRRSSVAVVRERLTAEMGAR